MNGAPSINGLRHQITLQNRLVTKDGFGQEVGTWLDVATCYAQVEPVSGMSQEAGEAAQSQVKYQIFIRYRGEVTARMRVIYRGRILEIDAAIDMDERHKWIQLDCTQGLTIG